MEYIFFRFIFALITNLNIEKMKIITKLINLSFILLVGFSSCTIQKRIYTKGYHVTWPNKSNLNIKKQNVTEGEQKYFKIKSADEEPNFLTQDVIASTENCISIKKNSFAIKQHNIPKEKGRSKTTNMLIKDKVYSFSKIYLDGKQKVEKDTLKIEKSSQKEKYNEENSKITSKRKLAIIIGGSLLFMALISGLTVPGFSALFVLGNPALTALNVTSNFSKYALSVVGWLGIALLDLLTAFGVYKYYKKEKPKSAKLTGVLRFIYSAILGVGIFKLLSVSPSSSVSAIYNSINMFNKIWGLGLIVFGFHLIALGITFDNEGGKKWVEIAIKSLLILAGIGYIIQYVGILLVANPIAFAAIMQPIFIIPMILCEISYAIWKLIKGGKKAKE